MLPESKLLEVVRSGDVARLKDLIAQGVDVNAKVLEGAPILFAAVQAANPAMVEALLTAGANPNLIADEPAASNYAVIALDLVMELQSLASWDRYTPIYGLLVAAGAKDPFGKVPTDEETIRRMFIIRKRQSSRKISSSPEDSK